MNAAFPCPDLDGRGERIAADLAFTSAALALEQAHGEQLRQDQIAIDTLGLRINAALEWADRLAGCRTA